VILGKVDAHRVVLRLVPAGDDIQARPSPPRLVDSRHRLGRHDGMVESGVDGREHDQAFRVRQQRGRQSDRVEHALVEVSRSAIADPPRDWEHEVDP
jgi:hypothetical protein